MRWVQLEVIGERVRPISITGKDVEHTRIVIIGLSQKRCLEGGGIWPVCLSIKLAPQNPCRKNWRETFNNQLQAARRSTITYERDEFGIIILL